MKEKGNLAKFIICILILEWISLLISGCVEEAPPVCPVGEISDADNALLPMFEISSSTFSQFEEDYQIFEFYWQNAGFYERDNLQYPYAKTLNAAMLLEHGLSDDDGQWHSAQDYKNVAKAIWTVAHEAFFYVPSEDLDYFAYTEFSGYGPNRVLLSCNLFNDLTIEFGEIGDVITFNTPSSRAGAFIHEGWHNWQWDHGLPTDHYYNEETGYWEDLFCPHILENYSKNELHLTTKFCGSNSSKVFHSPNQVQVEFLCDLACFGNDFVPEIIKMQARAEANHRLVTRFISPVGYVCGDPRP